MKRKKKNPVIIEKVYKCESPSPPKKILYKKDFSSKKIYEVINVKEKQNIHINKFVFLQGH